MNHRLVASLTTAMLIIGAARTIGSDERRPAVPPRRPADYKPFRFEYSTEQLKEKFSADQMARAAKELEEMRSFNENGPWKSTWESLDKHQAPEWYRDAKLGIMFNWGLHSVPAWDMRRTERAMYPDAYGTWMYMRPPNVSHHAEYWGSDFQFDDFFPLFRAEGYDPEALAALFKETGARYVITMSKHHDGVAWWDSRWTMRNFVRMGPKRDLFSPLKAAVTKRGLKTIMYFTYEEYAFPLIVENDELRYRTWQLNQFSGIHPLTDESRRRISGYIPVRNYYDQYMTPLVKEMIDRFDPDGLWMDGDWTTPVETLRSRELVAYLYNKAEGRKEVAVNDRFGIGANRTHGDFYNSEYNVRSAQTPDHAWEECHGISVSFAYNYEDDDERLGPPALLIHRLIDVVSHNGNLAIIGGPPASGVYPDNILRRLKALGAWLKVNGEAIYATRVFLPYEEGDVRYTRSKDAKTAYAICEQWPGRSLTLRAVRAEEGATIRLLGVGEPLEWEQDDRGLTIFLPDALQDEKAKPCRDAWAFKIPMQPTLGIKVQKDDRTRISLEAVGSCEGIVYTLDGSAPRAASAAYSGTIVLPEGKTTTVLARPVRGGKLVGPTASGVFLTSPPAPPRPDVYLDSLDPRVFKTGWQAEGVKTWRNVNCHGQPLKISGRTFARGVGMHANGEAAFSLKPEYRRFVCRVGVDDAAQYSGSVLVKVYLDQKLLGRTPVLTGRDGLWSIDVRLEGATDNSQLRIVIEDNGDGNDEDNVDLVDAGFIHD
jgi:alpha-L-fucosidase